MVFKLSDCAPDIAALVERHDRDAAAHRAVCHDDECERCGRGPAAMRAASSMLLATLEAEQQLRAKSSALGTLPARFAGVTLVDPWLAELVGPEALAKARTSLTAERAIFVGPTGAGKTSLAAAMFRAAVEGGRDVLSFRWVSSHALAKARASSSLGEEAPLVERCLRARLLVVDELGQEDARHASAVVEVLYERHAEGLSTWVTTGAGPKALSDRYGGGIARRLYEGAALFRLGGRP